MIIKVDTKNRPLDPVHLLNKTNRLDYIRVASIEAVIVHYIIFCRNIGNAGVQGFAMYVTLELYAN